MGCRPSRHTCHSSRRDYPLLDQHGSVVDSLLQLSSAHDPVYRAAFREYISTQDIATYLTAAARLAGFPSTRLAVFVGDVYVKRYLIVREIGSSDYETVWAAVDLHTYTTRRAPSCEPVALKVGRAERHYSGGTRRQIELAERVRAALATARIPPSHSPVVRVFNHFYVAGNGRRHLCLVCERLDGSLADLLGRRRPPLEAVRRVARDALHALAFLHDRCGLVHTDLKPSNIFVTALDASSSDDNDAPVVKIGNLGHATEVDAPRVLAPVGTVQYRAPEVLIGMHYGATYDVWSLGCTLFELLTGAKLFEARPDPDRGLDESGALLAGIYALVGRLPPRLRQLPVAARLFDDAGDLLDRGAAPAFGSIGRLLQERHGYEAAAAAVLDDFLRPMLEIDPDVRVASANHLRHPWLSNP